MRRFLRFLALRAMVLCVLAGAVHGEALRLRADVWMPYNGDPAAALPGYAIDVARAILSRHEVTLDYANMPWGDALKALSAGEIDAVIGANREEAEGMILPQLCIGRPRVALYTRKDSTWRYDNVASLKAVRLGVIADYKYWPVLDDYIARHKAPQVTIFGGERPLEDAIEALKSGSLDIVAETSSVFAWTAKTAGHANADFRLVYLHEGDPVYFAFAPGNSRAAQFATWFDEGLREMRKTGELGKILARYGQTDWE